MMLIFEVVDGPVEFKVDGAIEISSLPDLGGTGGRYRVELVQLRESGGGTLRQIFDYSDTTTGQTALDLDESGVLDPGRYILWTTVAAVGFRPGAAAHRAAPPATKEATP